MTYLVSLLFSFNGRIHRTVYWTFQIIWALLFIVIAFSNPAASEDGTSRHTMGTLQLIFLLISFWPLFAVQVKRWHDRNKSGWWCFIGLVPVIGGFWVLIECGFLPSVNEGNRFDA